MSKLKMPGYEIYEQLGEGGMAKVYRARHINLDRIVAIKVMDPTLNVDPSFTQRFVREARISAKLVHPHIILVYDVNSYEGINYLSMEYIGNVDLSHVIQNAISPDIAYQFILQMSQALDYAHGIGYVHRDIKPSNILIRKDGTFVLADFGIAKAVESSTNMTITGAIIGTPSYMSPEQAQGLHLDGRSDLYSLGVVFYKMITKELPYVGDSSISVAVKHLTAPIPTLPPKLAVYQPFIDRVLAKQPSDRFQSGMEMAEALGELQKFELDKTITINDEGRSTPYQDSLSNAGNHLSKENTNSFVTKLGKRNISIIGSSLSILLAGAITWLLLTSNNEVSSIDEARKITGLLSKAYSALNNDLLETAAINFSGVLAIDKNHSTATLELQRLELTYSDAIENAIDSNDFSSLEPLVAQFNVYFSDNSSLSRYNAALKLAVSQKNLAQEKAKRTSLFIQKAQQAYNENNLFTPKIHSAYYFYTQAKALDPSNAVAQTGLNRMLIDTVMQANVYIEQSQLEQADEQLKLARLINPTLPLLLDAQNALASAKEREIKNQKELIRITNNRKLRVQSLLKAANRQIKTDKFTDPKGDNAYESLLATLELEPKNTDALKGIHTVATKLLDRANNAIQNKEFDKAHEFLTKTSSISPEHTNIETVRQTLISEQQRYEREKAKQERIISLLSQAQSSLRDAHNDRVSLKQAEAHYQTVLRLYPENKVAIAGLYRIVDIYLASAKSAINEGEFKQANAELILASRLAPNRKEIQSILGTLPAKESLWIRQSTVNNLLVEAKSLLKRGRLSEAHSSYKKILDMENTNAEAKNGLTDVIHLFENAISSKIKSEDYKSAKVILDNALKIEPDHLQFKELSAQLAAEKATRQTMKAEQEKTIRRLIVEAQELMLLGRYSTPEGENALEKFQGVLKLDKNNRQANEGLAQVGHHLASQANQYLKIDDIEAAKETVAKLTETGAFQSVAKDLEEKISLREKEKQKIQKAQEATRRLRTR